MNIVNKEKLLIFWNNNKFFLLGSFLFAFILAFIKLGGDDTGAMLVKDGNIIEYWNTSAMMYKTWSSRVLINFTVYVFTDAHPIFTAFYGGILMYILLKSLNYLFLNNSKKTSDIIFIICLVFLFPFQTLSTAGWISTIVTYFGAITFGLVSLVPIKIIVNNKKLDWWKFILFTLCLIYASNHEQVMVVLLFSYVSSLIYYIVINKKINIYLTILALITIGSLLFTILCPGNALRREQEIIHWFPTFDHLSFLDKIELGYETLLQWLILENNIFFIAICALLTILIWKKYQSVFIRIISIIPLMITTLFGPLYLVTTKLFPQTNTLISGIPYLGLINPMNDYGIGEYLTFLLLSMCLFITLINMLLLTNNWKSFLIILILFISGLLSRVAIGLSPTLYASSTRINCVLAISIISCMLYVYANNKTLLENKKIINIKNINYVMMILALLSIINLIYAVSNTFA